MGGLVPTSQITAGGGSHIFLLFFFSLSLSLFRLLSLPTRARRHPTPAAARRRPPPKTRRHPLPEALPRPPPPVSRPPFVASSIRRSLLPRRWGRLDQDGSSLGAANLVAACHHLARPREAATGRGQPDLAHQDGYAQGGGQGGHCVELPCTLAFPRTAASSRVQPPSRLPRASRRLKGADSGEASTVVLLHVLSQLKDDGAHGGCIGHGLVVLLLSLFSCARTSW